MIFFLHKFLYVLQKPHQNPSPGNIKWHSSDQVGGSPCFTNRPALPRHSIERYTHRCMHFMLWNFKQPKYRTLLKTSVQETQSVWSHVPYLLRNVHRGLQRKSTLSSFGVRKYHKVTQVYFHWPGPSFTSWIQIVIMTIADDASFLSSTGGKSWKLDELGAVRDWTVEGSF